jgi:8-oxo-dGTP pyrophosphatase MutT (NUDIX family)
LASSAQRTARGARPSAAVAVILIPDPISVLLIRRSEREGDPWSGHVALPGGREEPEDIDLIATAIRESAEEVGILLDRSELLGALDDVAPRSVMKPPFMVRPFVFGLGSEPRLQLSSEVASTHWEPLETLMRAEARGELPLTIAGVTRRFPSYQTTAGTLWGMTERVLSEAVRRLGG